MFVIYADTIEEFREQVVEWLRTQSDNYKRIATAANRKIDRERDLARANECIMQADFIERLTVSPKSEKTVSKRPSEKGCLCQLCGMEYRVDFNIPDDLWAEISRGRTLLCGKCIARGIEDRGHFAAFKVEPA